MLKQDNISYKSVALIQSHSVEITGVFINELYLQNRFVQITVIGELKYKEIFLGNPRVFGFVSFECFELLQYDEVYCGLYNEGTGSLNHLRIK